MLLFVRIIITTFIIIASIVKNIELLGQNNNEKGKLLFFDSLTAISASLLIYTVVATV